MAATVYYNSVCVFVLSSLLSSAHILEGTIWAWWAGVIKLMYMGTLCACSQHYQELYMQNHSVIYLDVFEGLWRTFEELLREIWEACRITVKDNFNRCFYNLDMALGVIFFLGKQ